MIFSHISLIVNNPLIIPMKILNNIARSDCIFKYVFMFFVQQNAIILRMFFYSIVIKIFMVDCFCLIWYQKYCFIVIFIIIIYFTEHEKQNVLYSTKGWNYLEAMRKQYRPKWKQNN